MAIVAQGGCRASQIKSTTRARIDPSNFDRFYAKHPEDGGGQKPAKRKDQLDIVRADGVRLLELTHAQAHAGDRTASPI